MANITSKNLELKLLKGFEVGPSLVMDRIPVEPGVWYHISIVKDAPGAEVYSIHVEEVRRPVEELDENKARVLHL